MEVFNNDEKTINANLIKINNLRKRLLNISTLFNNYTYNNKSRIDELVKEVNNYSNIYKKMTYDQFRTYALIKTNEFKNKLSNNASLESIMTEALSVAREAIRKTLNMYPYDTQIEASIAMIGNIIEKNNEYNIRRIHERVLAEMKPSEGKTFCQILTGYLYLLDATKYENKKSVHIITYNDTLCKKDYEIGSKVFEYLGFSCGLISNESIREEEYSKDIVYASSNTIVCDYLLDNMILNKKDRKINKPFGYLIIDSADIILLDNAFNPVCLNGELYSDDSEFNDYLDQIKKEKYELCRWACNFLYGGKALTCKEYELYSEYKKDKFLEDYAYIKDTNDIILSKNIKNRLLSECLNDNELYQKKYKALLNAIDAKIAFKNGVDYSIEYNNKNKEAKIVFKDKDIIRKNISNKSIDGIKEAIEAKEEYFHERSNSKYKIIVSNANPLKAMCTYKDYLNLYSKGVCGLCSYSDIDELKELYDFETYKVNYRKKNIRIDEEYLYATKELKNKAIINEVKKSFKIGQPVLIVSPSLEDCASLDKLLNDECITHNLLTGWKEDIERNILKKAALNHTVTVANSTLVRGLDINVEDSVNELGGLLVILSSKNSSRRMDEEIKGICASKGNSGKTISYSSLEDDLIKDYYLTSSSKNKITTLIEYYKNEGVINNKTVKKIVDTAQEFRENKDKYIRKVNLDFDESYSHQKSLFNEERNTIVFSSPTELFSVFENIVSEYSNTICNTCSYDDANKLIGHLIDVKDCFDENKIIFKENLKKKIMEGFKSATANRFKLIRYSVIKYFNDKKESNKEVILKAINREQEKYVNSLRIKFLHIMDIYFQNHINELDNIRISNSISFSKNPLKDFTLEANNEFYNTMFPRVYNEMITYALNPNFKFGSYKIATNQNAIAMHVL